MAGPSRRVLLLGGPDDGRVLEVAAGVTIVESVGVRDGDEWRKPREGDTEAAHVQYELRRIADSTPPLALIPEPQAELADIEWWGRFRVAPVDEDTAALAAEVAAGMVGAFFPDLSPPEHRHRSREIGELACHPGCPAWVEPTASTAHDRVSAGRARLMEVAGREFVEALCQQQRVDELTAQIAGLQELYRAAARQRETHLEVLSELRIGKEEARDGARWLRDNGQLDEEETDALYGTMLPDEVKGWPLQRDVEKMAEQNAAADAHRVEPLADKMTVTREAVGR